MDLENSSDLCVGFVVRNKKTVLFSVNDLFSLR